jgi:protein phosphatase
LKRFLHNSLLPEIEASGLSVIGPVREDNQDSILLPDATLPAIPGSLFAVADGMGGYAHGGMASHLALETLFSALHERPHDKPDKALRRGVEAANIGIYKVAQHIGAGRMGTTITAAYIMGNLLHLAHVGDSRAYLVRQDKVTCLTTDHTVVGDMVRARLLTPEKVRTHAQRSILTRALGMTLFVQPDVEQFKLQNDDRLILCSDGVWSALQEEEIAHIARQSHAANELGQKLIDLAIENGTDDNCSTVVLHIHRFIEVEAPVASNHNGHGPADWIKKILGRGSQQGKLESRLQPARGLGMVHTTGGILDPSSQWYFRIG